MNYKLIECSDKRIWSKFESESPQSNLFCQIKFLDAYHKTRAENYKLMFVANGELILMGVVIVEDLNKEESKNPFMYQGVLLSQHIESLQSHKKIKKFLELTQFLLTELESLYGSVTLSLHHSLKDLRGFQWFNYHNPQGVQPNLNMRYTCMLDLKRVESFDQVLMNARTVRRQEYKKCIKNGFTVEESNDVSILDFLHEKTFERQGIKRSKLYHFLTTELATESLAKGFGRLLICRNMNNIPTSASFFLFDDKIAYYLIGASDPEYRKFSTGGFVVLEQIRKFFEQGLEQIDFLGINSPNRGDFKTSFGGIPVKYFLFSLEHKAY